MHKEIFDARVAEYYEEVVDKGYHDNKKYVLDLLKIIRKGESVLELGCGTGKVLLRLLEKGISAEGLDVSKSMVGKLKAKNSNAIIHLVDMIHFYSSNKYDYTLSCNGPFSIKGEELESYILDKKQIIEVLNKYVKMARKGLLINKGIEKREFKAFLNNGEKFTHRKIKQGDFVILINLLFQEDIFKGIKTFVKRRYKIKDVLGGWRIKDLGCFKLVQP